MKSNTVGIVISIIIPKSDTSQGAIGPDFAFRTAPAPKPLRNNCQGQIRTLHSTYITSCDFALVG